MLLVVALTLTAAATRVGPTPAKLNLPQTGLSEDEQIVHVLNRLGFGPRPGDVDRVRAMGLEAYVEKQLQPQGIPDPEVERRLQPYRTLEMDPVALLVAYPPPQLLRGISKQLTTRAGMDPEAVAELLPEMRSMLDRDRARKQGNLDDVQRAERERRKQLTPEERMRESLQRPGRIAVELSHAKMIQAVYSERQLQEVMTDFWFNHFNVFIGKSADRWWTASFEYDAIRLNALGNFRDLLGAVARHPAMLFYLDNWLSSAQGSPPHARAVRPYAEQWIKRHGLPPGGVSTLILRDRGMKTKKLERQIIDEQKRRAEAEARRALNRRGTPPQPSGRQVGLNENYARELLELHTLGVDGGYTQTDIIEVARCFTGWTLLPVNAGQQFVFVEEMHDDGKKVVLGKKVRGKKIEQGEDVLDRLARHPSTARFIATKLARRFVSDDPPSSLVDAMAATFLASDGDIRAVLRTLFSSKEFWSPEALHAKVKTPLEFVASAVRATGAELAEHPGIAAEWETAMGGRDATMSSAADTMRAMGPTPTMAEKTPKPEKSARAPGLVNQVRQLGQPLYGAVPPTGYDDTAEAWISTGALLNRMKFALGLAGNRIPGVRTALPADLKHAPSKTAMITDVAVWLTGRPAAASTSESIRRQLERDPSELDELGVPHRFTRSTEGQARMVVGWLLASPEFQRK
jgi:uncharacterized protein (DUF1800 family)